MRNRYASEEKRRFFIYDFDADEYLAFLVMEHLEGTSLKIRLHDLDCRDERMDLEADAAQLLNEKEKTDE